MFEQPTFSIIVPTYNEIETIHPQVEHLSRFVSSECEVIFVDGESTDGTSEFITSPCRLVFSEKGRGKQLNAGAHESSGAILFFLHCDCVIPDDSLTEMEEVLQSYSAGCFGLRFEPTNLFLHVCQFFSNYRAKRRQIPFGDQGIFIKRDLFFQLGGFPDIPIMEDYQFSLNAHRSGVRFGMTKSRVTSSSRRFGTTLCSTVKTGLKMIQLRHLYRRGVSPSFLLSMYNRLP